MIVRFWGTRGSLPVAATANRIRRKIVNALVAANGRHFADPDEAERFVEHELPFPAGATYGGATACVEIEAGDGSFVICDMGSGLREFGLDALRRARRGMHGRTISSNRICTGTISWGSRSSLPRSTQRPASSSTPVMPRPNRRFGASKRKYRSPCPSTGCARTLNSSKWNPDRKLPRSRLRVGAMPQHHSHGSYGYRFTDEGGQTVIFSTDSEHKIEKMKAEAAFIHFFRDADLVICDTMYSLADSVSMKEDWGHSSNIVAVDLCHEASASGSPVPSRADL